MVDFLQLAVLPQHISKLLRGQLGLHELLDLNEAEFLLRLLKLVLDEGEGLKLTKLLLDACPVRLDLGIEEGLLYLGLLLVVEAGFDRNQLDPTLEFIGRVRKDGHIVAECAESVSVMDGPLMDGLIEENRKDLEVIVGEKGFRTDIELVFIDGDAGLVEDHEQLLQAVVVCQQLGVAVDNA